MNTTAKLLITGSFIATLASCGGNGASDLDAFTDRVEAGDAQLLRLADMSTTGPAYMPTTGRAVFNGSAEVDIRRDAENDNKDILIIGDSRLVANFDRGTITGEVDNMIAATNFTETSADFYDVRGSISIGLGESVVGDDVDDNRTDAHNQWYADYRGTLGIDGDTYDVGGALDGIFLGNRVAPAPGQTTVRGLVGIDEDGYASINGNFEEVPLEIVVFGEH